MKTAFRILVAVALVGVLAVVGLMVHISVLHAKSRRLISQLVSEIQPGMAFSAVASRLGKESRAHTNAAEIEIYGTTKDASIVTNSTLHLFVHKAVPTRWICIYADRDSQKVIHASWKDM